MDDVLRILVRVGIIEMMECVIVVVKFVKYKVYFKVDFLVYVIRLGNNDVLGVIF